MSIIRLTVLRVNPSGDGVVPHSGAPGPVILLHEMPPKPDLEQLLERLEREEREVSTKRATIHERLASFPNSVLEEQERQLSERRKELHQEIDKVRARIR